MRVAQAVMIGLVGFGVTLGAKPTFLAPAKAANAALVKDCKSCHVAMPCTGKNLNAVGEFLVKKFGEKKVTPADMAALKDYKAK